MLYNHTPDAAGSSKDTAFSSSDFLNLAVGHARCLYSDLAITKGWPVLLGFHGTDVKVVMPLPFNARSPQKWAVGAEITWVLHGQSCEKAAVIYPVSIRSVTDAGRNEGERVFGLLVVAHETKRPDEQAFLPELKRVGLCSLLGEAINCTGLDQGITHRDFLGKPRQN
jgi:hypothetical protein